MKNTPTKKQLEFIQKIELEWGFAPFSGRTFKDAQMYIADAVEIRNKWYAQRMKEKPTEKQLNFIRVIEDQWGFPPFTGKTKSEASSYIRHCVEEQKEEEFEDAIWHSLAD